MSIRGFFFILILLNMGLGTAQFLVRGPQLEKLPDIDPTINRLVLLSEQEKAQGISGANAVVNAEGLDTDQLVCFSLGPFPSKADVRKVVGALAKDVERVRQREEKATQNRGYWVYLSAVETRERALEIARELSALAVRDYYVVTAGDRENTVSLGLFRQRDNAIRRRANIQALGFDAQLTIRQEKLPVYYLDYARALGSQPEWENAIAGIEDAARESITCFEEGETQIALSDTIK